MARGVQYRQTRTGATGPVSVTVSGADELDAKLRRLSAEFPKEAARSLNTTAARATTRIRRELANVKKLKQKQLTGRIKSFKATAKKLRASVWIGLRGAIRLDLAEGARFDLRSSTLRAGRNRVKVFRATMPSGHSGLYVRAPDSRHRRRQDGQMTELPIEEPRVRLRPEADGIALKHSREQMRVFYPVELKRLIAVTIRREAARRI